MRKPSVPTRCKTAPVAAQRRAMFPVFGGISGSTSTTWSGEPRSGARRRGVAFDVRGNGDESVLAQKALPEWTDLDWDLVRTVASPLPMGPFSRSSERHGVAGAAAAGLALMASLLGAA